MSSLINFLTKGAIPNCMGYFIFVAVYNFLQCLNQEAFP